MGLGREGGAIGGEVVCQGVGQVVCQVVQGALHHQAMSLALVMSLALIMPLALLVLRLHESQVNKLCSGDLRLLRIMVVCTQQMTSRCEIVGT